MATGKNDWISSKEAEALSGLTTQQIRSGRDKNLIHQKKNGGRIFLSRSSVLEYAEIIHNPEAVKKGDFAEETLRKLTADANLKEQQLKDKQVKFLEEKYEEFYSEAQKMFQSLKEIPERCGLSKDQILEFNIILKEISDKIEEL